MTINNMIIGYRNYRSYDEVMIKLAYDEFVTIYYRTMALMGVCLTG